MSPNKPGLLHYRRLIDEFAKPDLRSIGDSVERIGSRTPLEAGNLHVLKNSNQRMCLFRKRPRLHRRKFGKVLVLKFLLFGVLLLAVFGFVVMALWNWLTPPIFGLRAITYWQAVGLLILSKILFGGFRGRPRLHRGGHWGPRMAERWAGMTPAERGKFRERMWQDFGPFGPPPEPKP